MWRAGAEQRFAQRTGARHAEFMLSKLSLIACFLLLIVGAGCPKQAPPTTSGLSADEVLTLDVLAAPDLASTRLRVEEIADAEVIQVESDLGSWADLTVRMDFDGTEALNGETTQESLSIRAALDLIEVSSGPRVKLRWLEEDDPVPEGFWLEMLGFAAMPWLDDEGKLQRLDIRDSVDPREAVDKSGVDAEYAMQRSFADTWFMLATLLHGEELTIGKPYEIAVPDFMMQEVGLAVSAEADYTIIGRVGCDGDESGHNCILVDGSIEMDPDTLTAKMIERLKMRDGAAWERCESVNLRMDATMIVDPTTLMPHRFEQRLRGLWMDRDAGPVVVLERRDFRQIEPTR